MPFATVENNNFSDLQQKLVPEASTNDGSSSSASLIATEKPTVTTTAPTNKSSAIQPCIASVLDGGSEKSSSLSVTASGPPAAAAAATTTTSVMVTTMTSSGAIYTLTANGKKRYICRFEGCTNRIQQGGFCKRHRTIVSTNSITSSQRSSRSSSGSYSSSTSTKPSIGTTNTGTNFIITPDGNKRYVCKKEQCTNRIQQGGLCKRHGAKIYLCTVEGCGNQSKKGGLCIKHGAKVKRYTCNVDGCMKQAQVGGICIRHGAKAKICLVEGCVRQACKGGICVPHGATAYRIRRCKQEGCEKKARKGGICIAHGAEEKRCNVDGCNKHEVQGGVCVSHGAITKRCYVIGCIKQAQKGGICIRHRKQMIANNIDINDAASRNCPKKVRVKTEEGEYEQYNKTIQAINDDCAEDIITDDITYGHRQRFTAHHDTNIKANIRGETTEGTTEASAPMPEEAYSSSARQQQQVCIPCTHQQHESNYVDGDEMQNNKTVDTRTESNNDDNIDMGVEKEEAVAAVAAMPEKVYSMQPRRRRQKMSPTSQQQYQFDGYDAMKFIGDEDNKDGDNNGGDNSDEGDTAMYNDDQEGILK